MNRVKSSLTRMINRFSLQAEANNEPEHSVRQPIYTRAYYPRDFQMRTCGNFPASRSIERERLVSFYSSNRDVNSFLNL